MQQRLKFHVADLIKLGHIKSDCIQKRVLICYFLFGLEKTTAAFAENLDPKVFSTLGYLEMKRGLVNQTDPQKVVEAIRTSSFSIEEVPSEQYFNEEVNYYFKKIFFFVTPQNLFLGLGSCRST